MNELQKQIYEEQRRHEFQKQIYELNIQKLKKKMDESGIDKATLAKIQEL